MPVILVVDDVAPMAELYARDLERRANYATLTANSGDAALELLENESVDCVILDLEMPGMDGLALLSTLREREITAPVIVYTGTQSYERCAQAISLGAFGFIDKAEPIDRVVREVENALEQARLVARVEELEVLLKERLPSNRVDDELAGHGNIAGSPPDVHPTTEGMSIGTLKELKFDAETRILKSALERNDWHITQTAKDLGLADHSSLLKIMRRHGLKRP